MSKPKDSSAFPIMGIAPGAMPAAALAAMATATAQRALASRKGGSRGLDGPPGFSAQLQELRQARSEAVTRMEELSAISPGAFSAEDQAEFDQLRDAVAKVDAHIRRIETTLNLNEPLATPRASVAPAPATTAPFVVREGRAHIIGHGESCVRAASASRHLSRELPDYWPQDFGIGDVMAEMMLGTGKHAGGVRALGGSSDAAGGVFVPDQLLPGLIDRLRATTVAFQLGATTVMLEDGDSFRIARVATDPTVAWRNENAAIAQSDPTFDAITLIPRTLACIIRISRELAEDAANLPRALQDILINSMAVELDRVTLIGTGTAPQPRGIANTPGVTSISMGTNGAALTNHDRLVDAMFEVESRNGGATTGFAMAPRTIQTIRKFKDTTGQPLQLPPSLQSVPMAATTSLPVNETQGTATNATRIIGGNWPQVLVGIRTQLQLTTLRERFMDTGEYGLVAWMRADVAVAQPGALSQIVGVVP